MADIVALVHRLIGQHAPSREELARSVWLKPLGERIWHSQLWRFTRRSVPRGVFAGLLIGIFLMVPGLQIVGAALMAVPLRANIPIAAAMTFLSNPATTPLFLIAAGGFATEIDFNRHYAEVAKEPFTYWELPEVGHTAAVRERPDQYERRVIAFLDDALRERR